MKWNQPGTRRAFILLLMGIMCVSCGTSERDAVIEGQILIREAQSLKKLNVTDPAIGALEELRKERGLDKVEDLLPPGKWTFYSIHGRSTDITKSAIPPMNMQWMIADRPREDSMLGPVVPVRIKNIDGF